MTPRKITILIDKDRKRKTTDREGVPHPFFKGMSANSPAFLLAVLLAEGIVQPSESKRRCYDLGDSKSFLEEMHALAAETTPQKQPARKKVVSRIPSPPNSCAPIRSG